MRVESLDMSPSMQLELRIMHRLLSLNSDVLGIILQATGGGDALLSLSMTCRRIRSECLPLLFHSCLIRTSIPMTEMPIPSSLWPYIRYLSSHEPNATTDRASPYIGRSLFKTSASHGT